MAGLLTHLGVGFAGALIIYFVFYKTKAKDKVIYGGIFILGNILPDLIDFGFLGIKMRSLNFSEIMKNPLFRPLAIWGHTFSNWIIIALVISVIAFLLYKLNKISKNKLIDIVTAVILVLIGVSLHLEFDTLIQETNHWI